MDCGGKSDATPLFRWLFSPPPFHRSRINGKERVPRSLIAARCPPSVHVLTGPSFQCSIIPILHSVPVVPPSFFHRVPILILILILILPFSPSSRPAIRPPPPILRSPFVIAALHPENATKPLQTLACYNVTPCTPAPARARFSLRVRTEPAEPACLADRQITSDLPPIVSEKARVRVR
jgi:hypothetical protein